MLSRATMRWRFRNASFFIVLCSVGALMVLFICTGFAILGYNLFTGVLLPECIEVRHAEDDGINFRNYDSCRGQNIPQNGIEGHLYLPTPVDACSYISPPPGGFPTDSTWIALVYDYPACPTEMVINIRNAGYTLIIAASKNDSHWTVTKEVSDTLFPIVLVEENYIDYLKDLSFSTVNQPVNSILVSVHANLTLTALGGFGYGAVACASLLICCVVSMVCRGRLFCCKWGVERHLQKIENLRRHFACAINVDELDFGDQPHRSRFSQRKYMPFVHYNSVKNFKETVLKSFAALKSHTMDQAAVLEQLSKFPKAATTCSQHFRISLLHYACLNGWNDVVKDLVGKYSCDPNVKIYQPRLICDKLAKLFTSIDVLSYKYHDIDEKIKRVQAGEQEVIQSLTVNDGAAIHCACKAGHLDIVKFLIEKGCDSESRNVAGATPLHFACWEGHLDITRFLVERKGCDPVCTTAGLTPLDLACWKGHLHIVKLLVELGIDPKSTDGKGYTPLHVACQYGHLDIVKFLVVEQHCNHLQPAAKKSSVTPLDLANSQSHLHVSSFLTSPEISRQAHYEYLSRLSFPPAFKVFVMGNPGVGKSTLVKAIQNRLINTKWFSSFIDNFKKVSGVELNTAGIIPISIDSDKLGKIIMYDLAGQYEYYSSHAALLEELVAYPGSLLMVVVDLSKSTEDIIQTLHYWNSFIENHCRQSNSKPDIVTVGSHADVVRSQQSYAYTCRCNNVSATEGKSADVKNSLSSSLQVPAEIISLNCTRLSSAGLTELCDEIAKYCIPFQKTVATDIRLNFLHALFLQEFNKKVACTVSQIASHIGQYQLEWSTDTLSEYLSILSEKTQFLYLRNDQNVKAGWVILDQGVLLSEVNGTVFAPENFKEHHDISSSTGVVPFSNVKKTFAGKHNPKMIISFMSHLEFCHQIAEVDASLISGGQLRGSQQSPEKLYFFPALVSEDRPKESCRSIEQTHYKCGWSLHRIHSNQFLSPRFLHVLLLRLAFSFALVPEKVEEDKACPVLQRRCSVWKNGIHWQNRDGAEAIVEVVEQNTAVTVMIGCLKERELACTRLRSEVIRTILEVKNRFCGAVELRESLINPAELSSYPLKSPKILPSFTITELATAIAEDKQVVTNKQGHNHSMLEISELLYFEPYTCFNSVLLAEIFKDENSDKIVPSMFYTHPNICKILSEPSPTYKALRSALDKFSVFCGRNPLLLAGQTCQSPKTSASSASRATLQPTDNREYLTMSKKFAGITRALAANKLSESLADELKAHGMIGDTVYAHATNHGPDVTEYTRMKHLITAILTSTKSNPQRYYDFITVLQMDGIREDAEAALALLPTAMPQHVQSSDIMETTFTEATTMHVYESQPRPPPSKATLSHELSNTIPLRVKHKPTGESHDREATAWDLSTMPHRTDRPRLGELQYLQGRGGRRVKVIEGVAAGWEELAKALHFDSSVIEHVRGTEDACWDILWRWLEGETRQPVNWDTLIDSLFEAGFVAIATDLQEAVEDYPIDVVCKP